MTFNKLSVQLEKERKIKAELDEREAARLRRADPEAHFKQLKAAIKLKAHKKYQEDKQKEEEDAIKEKEPVVFIKDRFGRIMEKKDPKMSTTSKIPSKNRRPVKRAPPKRKLSFVESQMKYYGANDIFNPTSQSKKQSLTDAALK